MAEIGDILVVIPARGGSKRLPRKNILLFAGKPLICWTIEAALDAGLNARIIVTSDDEEILSIAREYEAQGVISHKRVDELATDTATTADVLTDVVQAEKAAKYSPSLLVVLQPTSPLRNSKDILSAIELFAAKGCNATVVSVCDVGHPTSWVGMLDDESHFFGLDLTGTRSQDYQKEYRLNGAVYVCQTETLLRTGKLFTKKLYGFVMPQMRSVDIDTCYDFQLAESMYLQYGRAT